MVSYGCQKNTSLPNESLPEEMRKVLEAHGGIKNWEEKKTLTFKVKNKEEEEEHKIDLKSRKVRIDSKSYSIGFDGKEVWVTPDKEAFSGSSPRFYHNLLFYFYAMPFVLSDPGIHYTHMDPINIIGKQYHRLKISYENGTGDAPDDEYIICYNPEDYLMEWLFYTVTYFSGKESESYNAIHYNDWQNVGDLLLPKSMTGYKTSGDSITDKRYERTFYDVSIEKDKLSNKIFEIPENAEIDSLIKH